MPEQGITIRCQHISGLTAAEGEDGLIHVVKFAGLSFLEFFCGKVTRKMKKNRFTSVILEDPEGEITCNNCLIGVSNKFINTDLDGEV